MKKGKHRVFPELRDITGDYPVNMIGEEKCPVYARSSAEG